MDNLFVYVKIENLENVLKYGMKLSEYSNKVLNISDNQNKTGIIAFLTPRDSELYYDNTYTCIKVKSDQIKYIIYNKLCESTDLINKYISDPNDYNIGDYEDPIALIYSTILPEHITEYNKIIDTPILIESSKEYYYEKCVNNMLDNEQFTKYELYQMLLILGNQKNIFKITDESNGVRVYNDIKYNKNYTKKGNV